MSAAPIPLPLVPNALEQAARMECIKSRSVFIRRLFIQDKDGQVRQLETLKRFQRRIANLLFLIRHKLKRPVRIIELKARKIGNSTYYAADQYCEVRDKGINAVIIAHDDTTSGKLLGMAHLFHAKDTFYDRPDLQRGNIGELKFKNFSGSITVETANNIKAGTGDTVQYLLASECSKWARGRETASTLMQAIAKRPTTTVILESTAYGFDEFFQPTWKNAYDWCRVEFDENDQPTIRWINCEPWQIAAPGEPGWNGYVPIFVGALEDPDCLLDFHDADERKRVESNLTEYERHLVEILGAPLEYLNFRRVTIQNECGGSLDVYNREYPETPELAFIGSGRPVFDRATVSLMPIETGRIGRLQLGKTGWSERIDFVEDKMGFLTVWRRPVLGHRYVCALDTAEGIADDQGKNPDATVCHIYDLDAGMEQVARLAGQISPKDIVEPWWLLMRWYNMAFGVPERNNTGEYPCIRILEAPFSYPEDRLYHLDDWDKKGRRMKRKVGFRTGPATRNNLIDTLAHFIDSGSIRFHSSHTQEELLHFVTKRSGKREADSGYHDDEVICAGLACKGAEAYPIDTRTIVETARSRLFGRNVARRVENDGYLPAGEL